MTDEMVPDIDLGDDHFLVFTRWAPDDLPGNRQWLGIPDGPLPVVEKFGAMIRHYRPDGVLCEGAIEFDGEWSRKIHALNCQWAAKEGKSPPEYHAWTVESWEPLTVSPSLLCRMPIRAEDGVFRSVCGDHGYIRAGKWVRA